MARTIKEIESDIRALSDVDRNHLLRDLVADLDGAMDEGVETAWLNEAEQRYKELKNGIAEPIPTEDVFAQARARLKK